MENPKNDEELSEHFNHPSVNDGQGADLQTPLNPPLSTSETTQVRTENKKEAKKFTEKKIKIRFLVETASNDETQLLGQKTEREEDEIDEKKIRDDHLMNKIREYLLNTSILDLLNDTFKEKNVFNEFVKLPQGYITQVKKKYNLAILDTSLKVLLYHKINRKYYENHNIQLIDNIYKEDKEKDVIYCLDLKLADYLNLFRHPESSLLIDKIIPGFSSKFKKMDKFLQEVKDKDIEKGKSEEEINYEINRLKELCADYEGWFLDKKSRNRKKKDENL